MVCNYVVLPREDFRVHPFNADLLVDLSARQRAQLSKRYWLVHRGDSLTAMRTALRAFNVPPVRNQLGATVSATSQHDHHMLGVIFLPPTAGAALVAHELSHAAFRSCEAIGVTVTHTERSTSARAAMPLTHETEEYFCYVIEQLTREFWHHWYAHGFAREPQRS